MGSELDSWSSVMDALDSLIEMLVAASLSLTRVSCLHFCCINSSLGCSFWVGIGVRMTSTEEGSVNEAVLSALIWWITMDFSRLENVLLTSSHYAQFFFSITNSSLCGMNENLNKNLYFETGTH